MKITSGLFDGIVLQRDMNNASEAAIMGTCACEGIVTASVTKEGKTAVIHAKRVIGQAAQGSIQCQLDGIPVGGPYEIVLLVEDASGAVLDQLVVRDVLVGDVWILGGQSNMFGCGNAQDAASPHPMVHACYMDDHWEVAADPLHDLSVAVDQIHADLNGGVQPGYPTGKGVGPGVAFGQEMFRQTGVPQGLIPCAHGGTTMAQWDPKLKRRKGRSLYGAMLRRFQKSGGKVAGVLWYQGCSDAFPGGVKLYMRRMEALARAMRRDFGDKDLPLAVVQISHVHGWLGAREADWNAIQDQQRRLQNVIRRCVVVPSIDLALDDFIHISGKDQQVLGLRLAQAMRALKDGVGTLPIAFKRVRVVRTPSGLSDVVVEFANVEGELQSPGRPCGLDLIDESGMDCIYRIDLQGNLAVLHTNLSAVDVMQRKLWYGYGLSPFCNIIDGAGRSLPAMGPILLGVHRAHTDYVRSLRVSAYQPLAGTVERLRYPGNPAEMGFQPRIFNGEFCDIHPILIPGSTENAVAYYACRIHCPEAMKLKALLGYDGPVAMWIDGVKKYADPHGTNPAVQDRALVPFKAEAGSHEILVALDSNGGKAWGIFLRFERLDVSKRQLMKGHESITLPEIEG